MRLRSTAGSHSPSAVERRAQPLVGELARQRIVEGRVVVQAVGRRPLHVSADAREVDRAHDRALVQRVAVAVFVVGGRQIAVVGHEGDGALVRPERRPRQAQARDRRLERRAHGVAPGAALARVVDLVEHHDRARHHPRAAPAGWPPPAGRSRPRRARPRAGRRTPPTSRDRGADERLGGVGPLRLEVLRRHHHHEPPGPPGQHRPLHRAAARTSSCRRRASRPPGSSARGCASNRASASCCHARSRTLGGRASSCPDPEAVLRKLPVEMGRSFSSPRRGGVDSFSGFATIRRESGARVSARHVGRGTSGGSRPAAARTPAASGSRYRSRTGRRPSWPAAGRTPSRTSSRMSARRAPARRAASRPAWRASSRAGRGTAGAACAATGRRGAPGCRRRAPGRWARAQRWRARADRPPAVCATSASLNCD